MIGLFKAILIFWIAIIVVRWYRNFNARRRNSETDAPQSAPRTGHSGRIEDAEFEDIDDNRHTSG